MSFGSQTYFSTSWISNQTISPFSSCHENKKIAPDSIIRSHDKPNCISSLPVHDEMVHQRSVPAPALTTTSRSKKQAGQAAVADSLQVGCPFQPLLQPLDDVIVLLSWIIKKIQSFQFYPQHSTWLLDSGRVFLGFKEFNWFLLGFTGFWLRWTVFLLGFTLYSSIMRNKNQIHSNETINREKRPLWFLGHEFVKWKSNKLIILTIPIIDSSGCWCCCCCCCWCFPWSSWSRFPPSCTWFDRVTPTTAATTTTTTTAPKKTTTKRT